MHTIIPHLREASFNDADTLPSDFDLQRFPILARHWFGLHEPAKPSAEVVDLNLVRLAAALHRLGEAIGADVGSRADMLKRIAPRTYGALAMTALDPETVQALDGDQFPRPPLYEVQR